MLKSSFFIYFAGNINHIFPFVNCFFINFYFYKHLFINVFYTYFIIYTVFCSIKNFLLLKNIAVKITKTIDTGAFIC